MGTSVVLYNDADNNFQEVSPSTPLPIGSGAKNPSSTQTRPNNTTAYAIGDVVGTDAATNLTFSNVSSVSGSNVIITSVNLEIDASAAPSGMSGFRLHLYNAAPTAITDNLAFNLPSADRTKYLGHITLDTPVDLGDTLWSNTLNVNIQCKLATSSTTLYGILETLTAFTPTAQCVKTITLNTVGV